LDCKQTQSLLSAYADGELDARGCVDIEEHLRSCDRCVGALDSVRQIKRVVNTSVPHYRAPLKLRREITKSTRTETRQFPNFATVTAFAACMVVAISAGWMLGRRSNATTAASVVFASHVRALMSEHLADVISTDKHTVKPWFNGKVDYSPPVNDLAPQGFPLQGGRLEFLNGRRVSVLVYGRKKHIIDLYVMPSAQTSNYATTTHDGFNSVAWSRDGFEFQAISDLNKEELMEFSKLIQNARE